MRANGKSILLCPSVKFSVVRVSCKFGSNNKCHRVFFVISSYRCDWCRRRRRRGLHTKDSMRIVRLKFCRRAVPFLTAAWNK